MAGRRCASRTQQGDPCKGYALSDAALCFHHDPGSADVRRDARRLCGLRRRKEGSIAGAYDIEGVRTTEDLRRLVEVVVFDTLQLANSNPRSRTMLAAVKTAMQLQEFAELEVRLARMERALALQLADGSREQGRIIELNPEAYKDAKVD